MYHHDVMHHDMDKLKLIQTHQYVILVMYHKAMNPFSWYLVILQYLYFKYRGVVFINTAHPYDKANHICGNTFK